MEFVYLALIAFGIILGFSCVYLLVSVLLKRIKGKTKERAILNCLKNCSNDCSQCNGNCEKFASGVVGGERSIEECLKLSESTKKELKNMLELKPKVSARKVAVVVCKGGTRCSNQFDYKGANMCDYSNKLFGGYKACNDACLGCMDCMSVCPTNAIKQNEFGVATIDPIWCIGCGECEKKCPDKLIKMISPGQRILFGCKKCYEKYDSSKINTICSVGCIKCGACVNTCEFGALKMENNAIVLDVTKCKNCNKCVYACPNNCITILKKDINKF